MNTSKTEIIWENGEYRISTDKKALDVALVHRYLSEQSYWAQQRPLDKVQNTIDNSFCFGLFHGNFQIGFARVVTDFTVFAYLMDVFVIEEYKRMGLGKQLLKTILQHPRLQGLNKWMLATKNAHAFYRRLGFQETAHPGWLMEKLPGEEPVAGSENKNK